MTAATATKKAASTSLSWEEWLHERDQAQSERDKAAAHYNGAQEALRRNSYAAECHSREISGQLAARYGNTFHIDRPSDPECRSEYLAKLAQLRNVPRTSSLSDSGPQQDFQQAAQRIRAHHVDLEAAAQAVAEAEEALEDAEDHLQRIESSRPTVSKSTISALDKQVADAESDAERIGASIARTEEEALALGVALEEIDLPSLAVDVELATDGDRKSAQAALASAQKRHDSLQAELARTEALLEGLQRRAAAADERIAETRSLRQQVAFEFLYPQLLAAESKLVEVVDGPLNDAMIELFRLQAEVNGVAPEDRDYSGKRLKLTLPWLHDENQPRGGSEIELPRRTEPLAIG